jgi:uncharacterized protein
MPALKIIPSMSNLVNDLLRTAPLIHRVPTPGGILKRMKYCARGLLFARETREWIDFLQMPEMALILKNHPFLYHKLQRPYLKKTLKVSGRLASLKQHYQFILTYLPEPLIEKIFVFPGLLLAELPVEKIGTLELRLACGTMEKEGDLMIYLEHRESGKRIATLSFSAGKCGDDGREIFIGGLQGSRGTSEDVVVTITRALYGLRPKALLVYVLQQLAARWEVTRL